MYRTSALILLALMIGCGKKAPDPAPEKTEPPKPAPPGATPTNPNAVGPKDQPKVLKPVGTINTGFALAKGYSNRVYLSEDGGFVAVGSSNAQNTQIWKVEAVPKKLREFPGGINALSPDGSKYLRFVDNRGKVPDRWEVASAETGKVIAALKQKDLLPGFVNITFSSPDSVVGLKSGEAVEPKKPGAVLVREFSATTGTMTSEFEIIHENINTNFAFFNGGKGLAVGVRKDDGVEFWDLAGKQKSRAVTLATPPAKEARDANWTYFTVSEDGNWLALSGRVYDAATGIQMTPYPQNLKDLGVIGGGSLVPGTRYIYSRSRYEGTFPYGREVWEQVVYDFTKKAEVATMRLPDDSLTLVHFRALSANDKVMITQRENGELTVWDLAQIP